jgi:hypothetical protein
MLASSWTFPMEHPVVGRADFVAVVAIVINKKGKLKKPYIASTE